MNPIAYKRRRMALDLMAHCQSPQLEIVQPYDFFERTWVFVENWLTPNEWHNANAEGAFDDMQKQYFFADIVLIADVIKGMNYPEFLKTPYWKTVAHQVRKDWIFQCSKCANIFGLPLHAHHKTYERLGYEIRFWREDLICICEDCHAAEHGRPVDIARRVKEFCLKQIHPA